MTVSSSRVSASSDKGVSDTLIRELAETDDTETRRCVLAAALAALGADALLPLLKAESLRYFAINSRASLRLAEALVMAAERTNRPGDRALGLLACADALRFLGRHTEAIALYEQARAVFAALDDAVNWARTFTGWVYTEGLLGRGEAALRHVPAAYDTLMRHEQPLLAARLDQNTALVYRFLGRYAEALRHYERAQRTFDTLGPAGEEGAARARANRADILALLGKFGTALALHEEARAVFERRGATRLVQMQAFYIANISLSQGRYTHGLRLYSDAHTGLLRAGQDEDAAVVALQMVACYLRLNDLGAARTLAEETVAQCVRTGPPNLAARAQFACALALARAGERERALALLDAAAQVFAAAGMRTDLGLAALERARLYLDGDDFAPAQVEAEAARALFAADGHVVRRTQADFVYARAALGLGDSAGAATLAHAALATAHAHALPWLGAEGEHLLAQVAAAGEDAPRALAHSRAAIAHIERVQSRLTTELRGNFLDDKIAVYHDAIAYCLRLGKAGEAFALLERAKSRALVDYLAAHPGIRARARGAANRELLDELERLRGEHDWFTKRLVDGEAAPGDAGAGRDAETRTLRAAVEDRERRITRVLERLALHRDEEPDGLEGVLPLEDAAPPAPADGSVLLEYYLHESGGAVFVASARGVEVVPLPATPQTVAGLVGRWQLNLNATARALAAGQPLDPLARNARGILGALYRALLAPVAPMLAGATRVVVVPYGATHAVPFHALHDGTRFLIETATVVTSPSSHLLRLCEARPRAASALPTALVLACSDGGRLPFVRDEARAVAALWPGALLEEERATRAELTHAAPRHGILHLAAHGAARLDNPTFAHLQLADGQLRASDVFNLALDGVLVTLSACETGRAVVTGGDELVGLSRGFLYAGAATLVQSLWRVDDRATARLMAAFYAALRRGMGAGAALREAQLALLADGGTAAHPFFWAPFGLTGADGPLARVA